MIRLSRVPAAIVAAVIAGVGAPIAFGATPQSIDSAYLLDTCPVSGETLGSMGDPIAKSYEGREVKFCCKGCVSKFEAAPESFLSQIDAKIVAEQAKDYPLGTCPVTGEKLGTMGDSINYVHQNRLVRLCCADCKSKMAADPQKYLAPLNQAVADAQKDNYPLATCVVSGQNLGEMDEPVDVIVGGTLVRLCCAGCVPKLAKDPAGYLDKLPTRAGTAGRAVEKVPASPDATQTADAGEKAPHAPHHGGH